MWQASFVLLPSSAFRLRNRSEKKFSPTGFGPEEKQILVLDPIPGTRISDFDFRIYRAHPFENNFEPLGGILTKVRTWKIGENKNKNGKRNFGDKKFRKKSEKNFLK